MIHPTKAGAKVAPVSRAVVHITADPRDKVHAVTPKASFRFANHEAFLNWITDPQAPRGGSQIWLTPNSTGWDAFIPALLCQGYKLAPSKRRGKFANLRVIEPGLAVDANEEDTKGRSWQGRSAGGLVTTPASISPEEQARMTWEHLDHIAREIEEHWPGATLGPSLASTAVSVFRHHLKRPIGCSKLAAKRLRELDAYGGGRIECFVEKGSTFTGETHPNSDGEVFPFLPLAPVDIDLTHAYMTAMMTAPIGAEFVDFGPESSWCDLGNISTVLIDVPRSLYPPLRLRIHGDIFYPYGRLFGTWTAAELNAAVALGAKVLAVHSVMRFLHRDEFSAFAEHVTKFRKGAQHEATKSAAKGLAVQLVGALASQPSLRRFYCSTRPKIGSRIDRPGVYEEDCFRPSEREILSAACTITGTVRAWMAVVLGTMEMKGFPVTYVHTDGLAPIGDCGRFLNPTFMAFAYAERAEERPDERADWLERIDAINRLPWPEAHLWKVKPLRSMEIYAANQRISIDWNGEEKVAAGGISRALTALEVRGQLRTALEMQSATAWMSAGRNMLGTWSEPFSFYDRHPALASRLDALAERIRRRTPCQA